MPEDPSPGHAPGSGPSAGAHPRPFVHESLRSRSLYFSLDELQSRMQLRDPFALDLAYTRTMMGFVLFVPWPRAIVMIGLGGGSLAKFCHRHLPRSRIQVVEVNPHVLALRSAFHVPPDDARFCVLQADGACFVRDCDTRPEVLLVDGFGAQGQPRQLASQRFYDDCADVLAPGGLLVVNLHYGHAQHEQCLQRMSRSFAGALLVVDDGELSNSIVFARKGPVFEPLALGAAQRAGALGAAAARPLQAAFARIVRALEDRHACASLSPIDAGPQPA